MASRHGLECVERDSGLVAGDHDIGGVPTGAAFRGKLGHRGGAAANAQPVNDKAAGHDGEPGHEVVFGSERVLVLERPQHRLLDDFLGLVVVEQAADGVPLEPRHGAAQRVLEVQRLLERL